MFYRNYDTQEDVLDMHIQRLEEEYIYLLKEEELLTIHNCTKVYFTL